MINLRKIDAGAAIFKQLHERQFEKVQSSHESFKVPGTYLTYCEAVNALSFNLCIYMHMRSFANRVWSKKKNETLLKSAIFQLRKYNFMQNLIFHELTTFVDKIFWVKNHFDIEKLQFLKIKSDRFYT